MAMFRMAQESKGRGRIPIEQQVGQQADKPKPERSDEEKSWGDYFTEPLETLYVQMEDNETWKYTSHDEKGINLSTEALQRWFKRINKERGTDYNINNIKFILHNHLRDSKFSDRDYKQYRNLGGSGFKGRFLMYSNISKQVYDINKKEKDK